MAKDIRQRRLRSSYGGFIQPTTFGIATVANDLQNVKKVVKSDGGCCDDLQEQINTVINELNNYQIKSEKDQPNGYVGLGGDGKISSVYLPPNILLTTTTYQSILE